MMQQGEKYQCTNEECGCEISVTKGSRLDESEAENPTCCCGEEMELMADSRSAGSSSRSKGSRQESPR